MAPVPGTSSQSWHKEPALRLLVLGSLLNGLAFFATLPFLTLYLSDISRLSEAVIGLIVGSVALISAFGGTLGGVLADKFGGVRLIQAGLLLNIVSYAALAAARELSVIICLVCLLGVGRLLTEPAMKKLLSLGATGSGQMVFRIRYVTLCPRRRRAAWVSGFAVGTARPLLGMRCR